MDRRTLASILICGAIIPAMSQTPTPIRKPFAPITDAKLASIPDFVLPPAYKDRTIHPLPAAVDNTKWPWMPPIFTWGISGWTSGAAAAVSYAYTYEEQMTRKLATTGIYPMYTLEFPYHFLNNGDEANGADGLISVESFDFLKAVGGMTTDDFGGRQWGNSFGGWPSGYSKYYNAMKARASEYYKIDASLPDGEEKIKQYLYDHADGSAAGGLLVLMMNSENIDLKITTVSGRYVIPKFEGNIGHAVNIVGYDDNFNGGSYLIYNSWGNPESLFWAKYSMFKPGAGLANAQGIPVMFVNVRKDYAPKLAFKVSISHNKRNKIAIMTGAAGSALETIPTKTRDYAAAFNFAGGQYPMTGKGQSDTLELGLDLTDFSSLLTDGEGRLFLHVISKGGAGRINGVTLMDYTGGAVREIAAAETAVEIDSGATTTVSIPWTGEGGTALREAGIRTSSAKCFAQPGVAHRGGNPVRITLAVSGAAKARLDIHGMDGRPVFSNTVRADASKGSSVSMTWAMKDSKGKPVAPGIYYASITPVIGGKTVKSETAKINIID